MVEVVLSWDGHRLEERHEPWGKEGCEARLLQVSEQLILLEWLEEALVTGPLSERQGSALVMMEG